MAYYRGYRRGTQFTASFKKSNLKSQWCQMDGCTRKVRRSWRTGILHDNCRICRELILLYGPNIRVTQVED